MRLSAWQFDRFNRQEGNGLHLPVAGSHLSVYLEPGFIYRPGYKDLKAEAQLGFCLPLVEPRVSTLTGYGFPWDLDWISSMSAASGP